MGQNLRAAHFRAPPRPSLATLPRLGRLASGLADACTQGLSALRAAPWQLTAEAVSETEPAAGENERARLRFESDRGSLTALLVIDKPAISALIEAAMGGTGAEPAFTLHERPLSRIEAGVLRLAMAALATRIASALGDFLLCPMRLFEDDDAPELDTASGVAQFRFVLNIFSYSGEIALVFARDELERQIAGGGGEQLEDARASQRQRLQQEVGKSEITLTVSLATESLTLDTLASMQPGKLIALAATTAQPVTVWSGGIAAYEATLGRSGDRYAVTLVRAIT